MKIKAVLFDLGGTLIKTVEVPDFQENTNKIWSQG